MGSEICKHSLHITLTSIILFTQNLSLSDSCGAGRCIDTEESFKCLCPLGHVGPRCEKEVAIYEPGFSNDAYIAYPTPKLQRRLKVSLKFKPKDLNDGILLYCSESEEGHGDFTSLAIKDGKLEFRFDVGSGMYSQLQKISGVSTNLVLRLLCKDESMSEGKLFNEH